MDAFIVWLELMAVTTVGAVLLDILIAILIRASERRR